MYKDKEKRVSKTIAGAERILFFGRTPSPTTHSDETDAPPLRRRLDQFSHQNMRK